ncbi:MAG TPA: preprotein translocase subunit SecE [Acidobacteriota bacterium]|jgi:preprotein translocase subunit SecE
MELLEKIRTSPSRFRAFLSDVKAELKKTSWPSRKEVYGTTLVVIATVFFFGFYLFLVDWGLKLAVQKIFNIF